MLLLSSCIAPATLLSELGRDTVDYVDVLFRPEKVIVRTITHIAQRPSKKIEIETKSE